MDDHPGQDNRCDWKYGCPTLTPSRPQVKDRPDCVTARSTVAMHSPAPEIQAGYPAGSVADKDANPETTLGSAYSPVDYMSITSFPRLPEDDVMSGENTLKSRKDEDNVLSEQDTGQSDTTTKYPLQTEKEMHVFRSS